VPSIEVELPLLATLELDPPLEAPPGPVLPPLVEAPLVEPTLVDPKLVDPTLVDPLLTEPLELLDDPMSFGPLEPLLPDELPLLASIPALPSEPVP
jgi:hypothetical protein